MLAFSVESVMSHNEHSLWGNLCLMLLNGAVRLVTGRL
jgi:hypothetical protein